MTVRLNDSLQTEFSVEICDLWVATDTASMLLPMVPRPGPSTPIDSLARAEALMRTGAFVASDSVTIGATVLARFSGDSTAAIGSSAWLWGETAKRIHAITERRAVPVVVGGGMESGDA